MLPLDPSPRFSLGEIILTEGASSKLSQTEIESGLHRHATGDWGEIDAECRQQNNKRVEIGGTLASIYKTAAGVKFYIITESERTATTILLPEEY
jgi:hypothetical protein